VQETVEREHGRRFGPCGYVETQGAFAERVAAELRPRLGLECRLHLSPQTEFAEPRIRANSDVIEPAGYGWSEAAAWDALAEYARSDLASAL
jgi:UDP-glucose 4-epimerase